jgi:hypothetical protein
MQYTLRNIPPELDVADTLRARPVAGEGGAPGTTGSTGQTTTTTGPPACTPRPVPDVIPAGFVEYTDWSCNCRFYVPPSNEEMPPPISWIDCPPDPGGLALDCKMIDPIWIGQYTYDGGFPEASFTSDGKIMLAMSRTAAQLWYARIVAEADGPVRNAMMMDLQGKNVEESGCRIIGAALCGDHHLIKARGESANAQTCRRIVASSVGHLTCCIPR